MSASPQPGAPGPNLLTPAGPAPESGPVRESGGANWLTYLGLAPFFAFALLFLLLPTAFLMIGAFQDAQGTSRWRIFANCFSRPCSMRTGSA